MEGNRILIVDDHTELLFGLSTLLQAYGYCVDAAESGAVGLELLRQHRYQAIVLDFQMSEMNGLEFMGRMQARGDCTPVLILTASLLHSDQCLFAGAERVLTKPCKFELLTDALSRICQRYTCADA